MTQKVTLSGQELETLGLMKFSCPKCRDLFPSRCGEHRVIPQERAEPDDRKLELLVRPEQVVPEPKLLPYGAPLPDYTAPYEKLESEIGKLLKSASTQQ